MQHTILFEVGDWSGDGHSFCAEFLVDANKPLQDVREIHFKENDFFGRLCADYSENTFSVYDLFSVFAKYMPESQAIELVREVAKDQSLDVLDVDDELISDVSKISVLEEDEQLFQVCEPVGILRVWLTVLKVIDPSLTVTIETEAMSKYFVKYKGYPKQPEGSIHFYGFDDKQRHLQTPGYGVWSCEESNEFYRGD